MNGKRCSDSAFICTALDTIARANSMLVAEPIDKAACSVRHAVADTCGKVLLAARRIEINRAERR